MTLSPPDLKPDPRSPGPAHAAAVARMRNNPAVHHSMKRGAHAQSGGSGSSALPLVSVVTVVLNREKTLPDAIESVLGQTYQGPIEYILIDGASRDGTPDVIRKYEDRIAAWVSEPDDGISDAFNRGLGLANGAIVGILNSDDWYEAHTIDQVVETFLSQPGIGLACGRLQYWKDGRRDAIFPSQPERLGIDMTVNHPTIFVHRDLYERAGLFKLDYRYAMDYELVLRFQAAGARFASIDAVLANMRTDGAADRNWFRSLREMRRAQLDIFPGDARFNLVSWWWKLARSYIGRLLAALGLGALNRIYRSRFSRFRRSYENAE